jgi:hypothetical protein
MPNSDFNVTVQADVDVDLMEECLKLDTDDIAALVSELIDQKLDRPRKLSLIEAIFETDTIKDMLKNAMDKMIDKLYTTV